MSDDTISRRARNFRQLCSRARVGATSSDRPAAATSAGRAELSNALFTKGGQYGQPSRRGLDSVLVNGFLQHQLKASAPVPTRQLSLSSRNRRYQIPIA